MKIAIFLDSLSRGGGAERQAMCALGELTRRNVDVELVYYNNAPQTYPLDFGGGGKITCLPKRGQYLRFFLRLIAFLRQGRYDVVHAFMSGPSIYIGPAAWFARTPVVFGGVRAEYDGHGFIRMLHRIVNRAVTGWIVNSQATVPSMFTGVGATANRVHVVYNGIDPAAFQSNLARADAKRALGFNDATPVVTIVARLTAQKNIPMFLDVAALTLKQQPAARFLIVGDGELRPDLEARCRAMGLSDSVSFLGTRRDVPDILRATDVMTLTSNYEGVANTLLEAMCARLPIVTTDYAGATELITHGRDGYIVPMNQSAPFAARVVELLENSTLRESMGAAGLRTIEERFTIPAMATRLHQVYHEAFTALTRPTEEMRIA